MLIWSFPSGWPDPRTIQKTHHWVLKINPAWGRVLPFHLPHWGIITILMICLGFFIHSVSLEGRTGNLLKHTDLLERSTAIEQWEYMLCYKERKRVKRSEMYHFGLSWYTAFPLERTGTCVLILSFQLLHYSFKVFRALTIHMKKIIIISLNIISALEPSSQPNAIISLHVWSSCFHFFPKGNLTIFLNDWNFIYTTGKCCMRAIKNPPANTRDTRDKSSVPGSGRSPGVGNDIPLQYSCLENSMGRGAWWATVHGATKSQTQVSNWAHTVRSTRSWGRNNEGSNTCKITIQ